MPSLTDLVVTIFMVTSTFLVGVVCYRAYRRRHPEEDSEDES